MISYNLSEAPNCCVWLGFWTRLLGPVGFLNFYQYVHNYGLNNEFLMDNYIDLLTTESQERLFELRSASVGETIVIAPLITVCKLITINLVQQILRLCRQQFTL